MVIAILNEEIVFHGVVDGNINRNFIFLVIELIDISCEPYGPKAMRDNSTPGSVMVKSFILNIHP